MAKELTELRAWAVEQAVRMGEAVASMPSVTGLDPGAMVTSLADQYLAYVTAPAKEANRELIDSARSFDGRQDAGALIGMLADALEQAMGAK